MNINNLTKEVDVYCAWIDEAESRNRKARIAGGFGFEEEEEDQDTNPE